MTGSARPPPAVDRGTRSWTLWRRLLLTAAFLLLIVNPLVNYYLGITFVQGWYQSLGIGELRITSPLEGLESLLVTRQVVVPTLVGMLVPLVLALLLGRVLHALGLSRSGGYSIGRFTGTALTWLLLLGMALAGLWLALR